MEIRNFKFKQIGLAVLAAVGVSAFTSSAQAAEVLDLIKAGEGVRGENTLVDDNREYLMDNVVTERGQIDVGDSLRGHAIWSKLNGRPLGYGTDNAEMTSVFQVMVTGKEEVAPGEYTFTFGPDPSFAEAEALGLGGQAMMIFYQDSTPDGALDYDDPTSPLGINSIDDGTTFSPPSSEDVGDSAAKAHEEAFISTATNGEYFWSLGYTGDVENGVASAADGEGWATESGMEDNVLQFFDIDSGNDLTSANFSLNRLQSGVTNGLGDNLRLADKQSFFGDEFAVDFNGSQTFEGVRNELTAFEISTQSTLTFAVIPLPSAAAMGMLVLGGLGGMQWWRKRNDEAEIEIA